MHHFIQYLLDLAGKYDVNPYIFASIYIGAIPFFTLSLTWLIKRLKEKRSIVIPVISTGLFFTSAYIYLMIVGKNVPFWVYVLIGLIIVYGIYSTFRKIRNELSDNGIK